jgi:hypothetical protein
MPGPRIDYETPRGEAEERRPVSPVKKWAGIVLVIALAVGALWVGLVVLHWFSLGDMGP